MPDIVFSYFSFNDRVREGGKESQAVAEKDREEMGWKAKNGVQLAPSRNQAGPMLSFIGNLK